MVCVLCVVSVCCVCVVCGVCVVCVVGVRGVVDGRGVCLVCLCVVCVVCVVCVLCVLCVLCVVVVVVCVWCVCVCVCVCCGTLKKCRKKTRVWVQKRHRVYVQNVPLYTSTTRTCVSTCARGAGTHGDVLNVHTVAFLNPHTGVRGSSSVLLTKICPRTVITCFRGPPQESNGS